MKTTSAVLLFLLSGCALRSAPRVEPELRVVLSITPQTCVPRGSSETAVYAFVHAVEIPAPAVVVVELNGRELGTVTADPSATLYFARVGLGGHTLVVRAGGRVAERYFSVWRCE